MDENTEKELVTSTEAFTEHHFPEGSLNESQEKAADALDIAADITEEGARIVSLERTSDKPDAEICGICISDGKGQLLADIPVKSIKEIDTEYAKKNQIDKDKIKSADSFDQVYGKVNEAIKNAKLVVFRSEEDYRAFSTELEKLKDKGPETQKSVDVTKALLSDTGVCMTKVASAVENEIQHWNEPVVKKYLRIIKESFASIRPESHRETLAMAELFKAQRENEAIYQERKRVLKENVKTAKENVVLAKQALKTGKEDREILYQTEKKELREKIHQAKLEAKLEAKRTKADAVIWAPPARFSPAWLAMPRYERILTKRLIQLYPQNAPGSSDSKEFKEREKATVKDVREAKEKLIQDLKGPVKKPEKPEKEKKKSVSAHKTQTKTNKKRRT